MNTSEDIDIKPALAEGITLFNQGDYFEAHEAWESAWGFDNDPNERDLLQGLIQFSAAFFKLEQGVPSGAYKLMAKALKNLSHLPNDFYKVDMPPIISSATEWHKIAEQMASIGSTDFNREQFPTISSIATIAKSVNSADSLADTEAS